MVLEQAGIMFLSKSFAGAAGELLGVRGLVGRHRHSSFVREGEDEVVYRGYLPAEAGQRGREGRVSVDYRADTCPRSIDASVHRGLGRGGESAFEDLAL